MTAALEAADHFKLAAAALASRDVETAVAEARRADAAVSRWRTDVRALPDSAATTELQAQLGSLILGIGQGTGLILDPSLSIKATTIETANRLAAFVAQHEGIVARISASTTCPAP